MNVDMKKLKNLLSKRGDEIEASVAGTGYLVKTVIGVGTFLLDNEGDYDLLTARQKVVFEKFLEPLLERQRYTCPLSVEKPAGQKQEVV
jgi:hypothetical protein